METRRPVGSTRIAIVMVMLVQIENNTFVVPFRICITHKHSYRFSNTSIITDKATGLDFTKAVIVNDSKYIGTPTRIDDVEYRELDINHYIIIKRFKRYITPTESMKWNPHLRGGDICVLIISSNTYYGELQTFFGYNVPEEKRYIYRTNSAVCRR